MKYFLNFFALDPKVPKTAAVTSLDRAGIRSSAGVSEKFLKIFSKNPKVSRKAAENPIDGGCQEQKKFPPHPKVAGIVTVNNVRLF
jgi:hypothetical protein